MQLDRSTEMGMHRTFGGGDDLNTVSNCEVGVTRGTSPYLCELLRDEEVW